MGAAVSFWSNGWVITIGSGALLGFGGLVVRRLFKEGATGRAGDATISAPTGGTNIANTGTIRDVIIGQQHSPDETAKARLQAERDEEHRRDRVAREAEFALSMLLNTLDTSLKACEAREPISEPERGQVGSARDEWARLKPDLARLRADDLAESAEAWIADVEYAYGEMWDEQASIRDVAKIPGAAAAVGFAGPVFQQHRMRIKSLINHGKGTRDRYTAITIAHP